MRDISEIPPRSDPRWDLIACGHISKHWNNFALKIMMTRIEQDIAKDSTDANIRRCGDQIFEFFKKNGEVAAQDFQAIFH